MAETEEIVNEGMVVETADGGDPDTRYYEKTEPAKNKEKEAVKSKENNRTGDKSTKDSQKTGKKAKQVSEASAEEETAGTRTGRRVFLMRHAERIDRVFPGWIKLAFTDGKKYRPYDLNQPLSLPKRKDGPEVYLSDSPITEMGYVTAQMVGRGLRVKKVFFSAIYTSPALRCIQTGQGLLKTLNTNVKMYVDPGLFEWLGWYESVPTWMTSEELKDAGYNVDTDYKPILTAKDMMKKRDEKRNEHYERIDDVCSKILKKQKTTGPILIIGHATTVDAGIRGLLKWEVKDLDKSMDKVATSFPSSCITGAEESERGQWKIIRNAVPHISYLDATNRIDQNVFNRK